MHTTATRRQNRYARKVSRYVLRFDTIYDLSYEGMESSIVVDTDSLFVLDRIDDGGGSERCNGTSRFHGRTEAEAGGDVKYVRHVNHAMCMASLHLLLLLCVRACYACVHA